MDLKAENAELRSRALAAEWARDEALARMSRLLDKQQQDRRDARHHLRNLLSVISAITRRTSDEAQDVETYSALLDARLSTYMRIYTTLSDDRQLGIDLGSLVADELLGFGIKEDDKRICLSGPPVHLFGGSAGLMALAFNDLAMTLVLCGHPDAPSFTMYVEWKILRDDTTEVLVIDWSEDATPEATPLPDGSAWSGWLQQAICHQLDGTVSEKTSSGKRSYQFRLPKACFTHGQVVDRIHDRDAMSEAPKS